MHLLKAAVKVVAVGGAVVLMASASSAGEIKGKVSVQGLKSAENIAVYVDAIPDKKFEGLLFGAATAHGAAFSVHSNRPVANLLGIRLDIHHEAQLAQGFSHDFGVFAPERSVQDRFTFGQSCQQQRAVGNTLRTRHGDRRPHGLFQRFDLYNFRQ